MEPMLESFDASTSAASGSDLRKATMNWLDQSCSLVTLRKGPSLDSSSFDRSLLSLSLSRPRDLSLSVADVSTSLLSLSTNSSILSNPALLPEESLRAVLRPTDD